MKTTSRSTAVVKRLHLGLSERDANRLSDLAELTNAASQTEVIKRALLTYEALASQLAAGAVFYVKEAGEEMPSPLNLLIDVDASPPRHPRGSEVISPDFKKSHRA
ncbi:hypothetical protein FHR76_001629 [Rhizobium sp. RAS22]|nr:hypothetical protein [Rhizobium sp. RAS22]